MDALDQLLVSCHDYSLNLFVESFLKMVQKLLECDEIELQILATSSVSVGKEEIIFSSPEHEMLMVSYCDQSLSVVHRPCVVNFLL